QTRLLRSLSVRTAHSHNNLCRSPSTSAPSAVQPARSRRGYCYPVRLERGHGPFPFARARLTPAALAFEWGVDGAATALVALAGPFDRHQLMSLVGGLVSPLRVCGVTRPDS